MILISPTEKTLIKSQSYANILQHHSTILWMCFTCSFRNTVIYWYIKMADKRVTTVKTLKKWKEEFKFDYDLCDRKMNTIRCQLCLRRDSRTKTWKNLSRVWVHLAQNLKTVKKHSKSLQHCEPYKLQQNSNFGANVYIERIVLNSPLEKSFLWLWEANKDGLHIKLRTVYHNIKNNPYTDYPGLLNL